MLYLQFFLHCAISANTLNLNLIPIFAMVPNLISKLFWNLFQTLEFVLEFVLLLGQFGVIGIKFSILCCFQGSVVNGFWIIWIMWAVNLLKERLHVCVNRFIWTLISVRVIFLLMLHARRLQRGLVLVGFSPIFLGYFVISYSVSWLIF